MKVKIILFFILINSVLLGLEDQTIHKIDEFRTSLFKWHQDEGYYYVNLGLPTSSHVCSYLDTDTDMYKYTDLVTYNYNGGKTYFYINEFDVDKAIFNQKENFFTIDGNPSITNVYSGHLVNGEDYGFIITTKSDNNYTTYFLFNKGNTVNDQQQFNISPVFIGDVNGDRNIEVIYFDGEKRKILYITKSGPTYNIKEDDFSSIIAEPSSINNAGNLYADKPFSTLGAAMIDVDGDCRNDLIFTHEDGGNLFLEIYRGRAIKNTVKYILNKETGVVSLGAEKLGAFNLGDFNDDGFVDLIFPILGDKNGKPKVKVLYNINVRSYDWAQNYCEKHPEYTNESPKVFNSDPNGHNFVEYELDLDGYSFAEFDFTPSIIKVADLTNKAYPGFGALFKKSDDNDKFYPILFENVAQDKKPNIFKVSKIIDPKKANYLSFFDIDENGSMDILIDTVEGTIAVYNNNYPDAFFIKAKTVLSGKLYSTEVATNYRYIATNNDGDRRMDFSWQMAMTADLTMNTPYSLAGIGRSNNYIENLVVISSSYDGWRNNDNMDTNLISPVIPKTQLLIKKELDKGKVEWNVDLIISPTEKLILLMIVIGIILVIILIIIIILHIKETSEDKKQETGTEHFKSWFN